MVDLERMKGDAERAIRAAFPVEAVPSPDDLRNDHCPECAETAARFAGKAWPDINLDDVRGNPAPALLNAAGFRYYLPAMMLLAMSFTREVDCLPDGLIGMLSPKGPSLSAKDVERGRFTHAQAEAILAFLRFFELQRKVEWSQPDWPTEAILSAPTERPLERAIEYWSAPSSGDRA